MRPPALGEVPQKGADTQLDARELRDRALLGRTGRLACRALDQARAQDRLRVQARKYPVVEDRDDRADGDVPVLAGRQHGLTGVADGEDVAEAQEVGGQGSGEVELADDQAVADDQAERAAHLRRQRIRAPRPGSQADRGVADAIAGARRGRRAQRVGKVA
jgi:hypothetical protein